MPELNRAAPDLSPPPRSERGSDRFERKRELILDAATALINQRGVKGMTFLEIAQSVNLNTTSVTYYFRRKEQLAAAVFEHTIERLEAMARDAGAEPDPQARVARYLQLHFDHHRRVLRHEERPIATLSDIRALDDAVRAPLEKHYQAVFPDGLEESRYEQLRDEIRYRVEVRFKEALRKDKAMPGFLAVFVPYHVFEPHRLTGLGFFRCGWYCSRDHG